MKKGVIFFLMLLALLCSGCIQEQMPPQEDSPPDASAQRDGGAPTPQEAPARQEAHEPTGSMSASLLLESYLSELDTLETPSREYGESASYILMGEDLVVRVLYPVGELTQLDQAVEKWVLETAAYYQDEAAGSSADGDAAELTVEYSSYLVAGELVGIKLTGVFERPYLAHPVDVSATFNASMETGKLLTLADVLLPGGTEILRDMVAEQAGIDTEIVDSGLLNHWLLTPEGLEITLVRGDYLPMSDGTVTLLYPYEELDGIFAVPYGAEHDPVQTEEPQGETTPKPAGDAPSPTAADPSKPMIALTFDDGPSAHTERLLDIFVNHGGKGTFYVVGNMIDSRADTLRRMAAQGHEIGGHSWNHRQLTKLSVEELTDQMMNTRAKIYDVTGVDATTVRPPYGSYNDQVKATSADLGIVLVNWSVDTLDWKYKNADTVYNTVLAQAADGAIILCHDLHKTTVDAMERAIPDLIAKGYQLVTVSELLSSSGKAVSAGSVYFKR